MSVHIRRMQAADIDWIYTALNDNEMGKPLTYIESCWTEQQSGERVTFVAQWGEQFAGWLHLLPQSYYPPFRSAGIPEINNFEVIPAFRRKGVGEALMDAVEEHAFTKYQTVGIGVGLYASYGQAQRLYARRGYLPDGRGIYDGQQHVQKGDTVEVGHDLALYMTKEGTEGKRSTP